MLLGTDDYRDRSGGISISLVSPDGRVIGGAVGGMLIAASPVQVSICSPMIKFRTFQACLDCGLNLMSSSLKCLVILGNVGNSWEFYVQYTEDKSEDERRK